MSTPAAFKKELKALLAKYDAYIGFSCDEGSDTHGISGSRIVVGFDTFHCRAKDEIILAHEYHVSKEDL